nr:hypothetical protein [Rhodococcus sp. (in: high G+C Gram-positive bacteria)]
MRTGTRRGGVWIDVVVVTVIVAVGIAVAGVTDNSAADVEAIPGCDVVLPADDGFSFTIGSYAGTYGNPDYPWLTAAKASAMSDALIGSLPSDVEVAFAGPSESLVFQPMLIYPGDREIADGVTVQDISGDSTASGVVGRDGHDASLRVSAEESDGTIPPCREGRVDERATLSGGIVVDTQDAVSDFDGVSTHRRTATAYFSDTVVSARTSSEGRDSPLPLEVDELRRIVSNPELRTSTEAPDDTPPPRRDCGSPGENPVAPLPKEVVERIGAALAVQWAISFPDARTDRPVGDLVPGRSGSGSACTIMNVTTPSVSTEMTIDVSLRETIGWSDSVAPTVPGVSSTTLLDGTVVTTRSEEDARSEGPVTWVSVLRPSNTLVQIRVGDTVNVDSIVDLATAPGLDL